MQNINMIFCKCVAEGVIIFQLSKVHWIAQKVYSFNKPEHKQQIVSHGRGPEPTVAWSGCLQRNISQGLLWEYGLTHWTILLVLAAKGLYWGSRVGLFRVDLAQHSRMIGGIRASKGLVGLMFCLMKEKVYIRQYNSMKWNTFSDLRQNN